MTESEQNLLATRLDQAWPNERLQALGPQQKQLLSEFVGQEVAKLGDKCPTVEQLQGVLWEVENYWPEELIPLSKSWEQPRQTNSELSESLQS
jgi:hypothetical protein